MLRKFWEQKLLPSDLPPGKREVDVRAVLEGVLYILETGCQWRHLPKDFPPRSTVWDYFDLWGYDGRLDRIHAALYAEIRATAGREASPTAAIVDSRTAKSAEKGGASAKKPAMMQAKRQKASKTPACRYLGYDAQDRGPPGECPRPRRGWFGP